MNAEPTEKRFKTFAEFYPYYLSEHSKTGTRISHFIGTTLFFAWTLSALVFLNPLHFVFGVVSAYFFAWVGHFFVEKNKPATFRYPWMSLKGDFRMYFEIIGGKEKLRGDDRA